MKYVEELGLTPTPDVAARSLEEMATIERIAGCSKNLKSSLQRKLQEAATLIRVATSTLLERAQLMEGRGEVSFLRTDFKSLGERNATLQKEISDLRER